MLDGSVTISSSMPALAMAVRVLVRRASYSEGEKLNWGELTPSLPAHWPDADEPDGRPATASRSMQLSASRPRQWLDRWRSGDRPTFAALGCAPPSQTATTRRSVGLTRCRSR